MPIQNPLASIAVKDLSTSVPWYEKLLGKPADSRPMPEVAEWKFERGGWLQVEPSTGATPGTFDPLIARKSYCTASGKRCIRAPDAIPEEHG